MSNMSKNTQNYIHATMPKIVEKYKTINYVKLHERLIKRRQTNKESKL